MRLDDGQFEILDPSSVSVWRSKPGYERLRIAHEMWELARLRLDAYLRFRHPEWAEDRLKREVAGRLSHESV